MGGKPSKLGSLDGWSNYIIWYHMISLVHSPVWVLQNDHGKIMQTWVFDGLGSDCWSYGQWICLGMYTQFLRLWFLWLEIFCRGYISTYFDYSWEESCFGSLWMLRVGMSFASGSGEPLLLPELSTLRDLKLLAQRSLGQSFPKLVTVDGQVLSKPKDTLQDAGVQDGEHITALVQQAN